MAAPSWSTLLEALHSALIDALNTRFPDTQLLLGLPKKTADATPPDAACTRTLQIAAEVPGLGTGLVILAASPELASKLALELKDLWALTRAQAESNALPNRGLSARFSPSPKLSPRQVIWFPMGVSHARVLLGLGIE